MLGPSVRQPKGVDHQRSAVCEVGDPRAAVLEMGRFAMHGDGRVARIEFVEHEAAGLSLILPDIPAQVPRLGPAWLDHAEEQRL
jgi:hypothetical protein